MNLNDIVNYILTTDSNEDLNRVIDAVEGARQRMAIMARISFRVGDEVSFRAKGASRNGKITKICQKNIHVRVYDFEKQHHIRWTVSPTLLTKES